MEQQGSSANSVVSSERRYDVDALRTVALALLFIYHALSSFQPWINDGSGSYAQNDEFLTSLWYPMRVLNVWRIPILFVISGMGACFALNRRDPRQFVIDRLKRVGLPLLFGVVVVGPLALFLGSRQSNTAWSYEANAVHLWFLVNILLYALLLSIPGKDILSNPEQGVLGAFRSLLGVPGAVALLVVPLVVVNNMVSPGHGFVIYGAGHGLALGLVCFVLGFLFAAAGEDFWVRAEQARWGFFIVGAVLAWIRLNFEGSFGLDTRYAVESMSWVLALLGFGSLHLNRRSAILQYLSPAVYPAYIAHFPIQFALSLPLFATDLSPAVKLVLLVAGTLSLSLGFYETVRRVKYLRLLFGINAGPSRSPKVVPEGALAR